MTVSERTTVSALPTPASDSARLPAALTRLVWLLAAASLGGLALLVQRAGSWQVDGLLVVDGLTVVMWITVTVLSGVVHSYARRYMAGHDRIEAFFGRMFAFTVVVLVLVAADSLVVFAGAWLAMGLLIASLVGHVEDWPGARAAAGLARRYFLASTSILGAGLLALWWATGGTTVTGVASSVDAIPTPVLLTAAAAVVLAAMIQSALLPFHTWLLSSMTAPTPASALMHAGFVNAGGVLLVRFGPVVSVEPAVMLGVVLVGAASAMLGKLLKTVQTDVKGKLGCSTVAQMGFMIMQAGLGFFAAAITHLVLHGCYKAYSFLASGGRVAHVTPTDGTPAGPTGPAGVAVVGVTALVGGGVFVALTGKVTSANSGLLLAVLVVITVLHAAREVLAERSMPAPLRYGAVPLIAIPAIAVYATLYGAVRALLAGLPAIGQPAELTVVHGLVGAAFLLAYVAMQRGLYENSTRLYVALLNAARPPAAVTVTAPEGEYES